MKVLRLIGGLDPEFGGPTESAVAACVAMQEAGHETTFCFASPDRAATGPDAEVAARLAAAGVSVEPFPFLGLGGLGRRWGISASMVVWLAANARHFDLIHLHGAWGMPSIAGLGAGRLFRKPVIISPHETLTGFDLDGPSSRLRRRAKRALRRLYLRWADAIVFSSQLELSDSVLPGTVANVLVIPHPVPAASGGHERRPPASGSETLTVGYLGRLHPKKNLEMILEAIARLPGPATLSVAGSGDPAYERSLRDLAGQLAIGERVEWLGFLDGPGRDAFLDSIDVLVLPSRYECFGMAVAEALVHGVPAVVSRRIGTAPIVERFECGFVVEAEPAGLSSALEKLLEQGELRERMGSAAREAARTEFSPSAYEQRLDAVYGRFPRRAVAA